MNTLQSKRLLPGGVTLCSLRERALLLRVAGSVALALFIVLLASPASAVIESYAFDSAEQEQRYQHFTAELRCPKCQNQNLADSSSPISEDLRRELHRLIQAGNTDEEITEFMVSRYGEFILYRPPLDRNTAVLWLFPIFLLLIAAIVLMVMLKRSQVSAPAADMSEDRQRQASALLQQFRKGE